jgi:hypothetical protein
VNFDAIQQTVARVLQSGSWGGLRLLSLCVEMDFGVETDLKSLDLNGFFDMKVPFKGPVSHFLELSIPTAKVWPHFPENQFESEYLDFLEQYKSNTSIYRATRSTDPEAMTWLSCPLDMELVSCGRFDYEGLLPSWYAVQQKYYKTSMEDCEYDEEYDEEVDQWTGFQAWFARASEYVESRRAVLYSWDGCVSVIGRA